MSYEVKTIGIFEKKTRRLIKKFPSLKTELQSLVARLKENSQRRGSLWGIPVLKSGFRLLPKQRVSQEAQE